MRQKATTPAVSMITGFPLESFLSPRSLTFGCGYTNICSMPVTCALVPRFRLIAATSGNRETSMERVAPHSARSTLALPAALAPEPGAAQLIGEVTESAERFGLRAGMRMGEALSRCPALALIPSDPERAESSWEEALRRLEEIGAEIESDRA